MKRIFLATLFLAGTTAFAQTPTGTPASTPEPTVTPLGVSVPRYISLVRFEVHDQYGPQIPQGRRDYSYEYVVSDQDGNELKRYTRVLTADQIPDVPEAGLLSFLDWLRGMLEKRTLPATSLTPFPTLTPTTTPTPPPTPTIVPRPSPTP